MTNNQFSYLEGAIVNTNEYNKFLLNKITGKRITFFYDTCELVTARTTKGIGSNVKVNYKRTEVPKKKRKKLELEVKPVTFLSEFNFNILESINIKNKKVKRLYNLKFKNDMRDTNSILYKKYIEKYNNQKNNGELDKVNFIIQRIDKYLDNIKSKKNDMWFEGYLPIAIGVILYEYVNNGLIITDDEFLKSREYLVKNNDELCYYIFLVKQIYTFKNHYCILDMIYEEPFNWFAYGKLMKRINDKPFRSKGHIYSNIEDMIITDKIRYYNNEGKQVNE